MNEELKPGDSAPAFRAVAVGGAYGEGREVSLADFTGQNLVLYLLSEGLTPRAAPPKPAACAMSGRNSPKRQQCLA
jgi:peroxiredoxin